MGATTTRYVYDVGGGLPTLLEDGSAKYVWGLGLAYTTTEAGALQGVYHTDGLGAVRALSDSSGNVSQTYGTDEFGIVDASQTSGSVSQPMQYTGEQRDSESSFMYLRARMYDPGIGRFLQRDPIAGAIGDSQALNRYGYVRNNPTRFGDPTGLCNDPGGFGIRYCIDRFIPNAQITLFSTPFGNIQFLGDDRTTDPYSDQYRSRQQIVRFTGGLVAQIPSVGASTAILPNGSTITAKGSPQQCQVSKAVVLQDRIITATCAAHNPVVPNAPPIVNTVTIAEPFNGYPYLQSARGTPYPAIEIYAYGVTDDPLRLLYRDTSRNTVWDLYDPDVDLLNH